MRILKIILFPFYFTKYFCKMVLIYLPGNIGIKLRYLFYRPRFKKCGKNVFIDVGVQIEGFSLISIGSDVHIDKFTILSAGKKTVGIQHYRQNNQFENEIGEIIIGNNVHIVQNCMIIGYGGIDIGNKCTISSGTKLYSQSNLHNNPTDTSEIVSIMPYEQAHFVNSPIVLKDNVWIGLNVIVMPSTSIGENSFVVSNSLLLSQFPPNSYISGQPAKKIRNRFE